MDLSNNDYDSDNDSTHSTHSTHSNQPIDTSNNSVLDNSCGEIPIPVPIVDVSYNNVIDGVGYEIIHEGGDDSSGNDVTRTTFNTDEPELYDPQIEQNLTQIVETYNDVSAVDSSANLILEQIKGYADELQCSDFHGKGSIDDYNELFIAAGKIANESKQMELDVDIEGFTEFAAAADELSNLFNGFIVKLQNVSIITDINFLTSISIALSRIVNLSEVFGRFKQTIFSTSAVQLPKSAHETKVVIEGVMNEVNCAMNYVNYFVSPEDASLNGTQFANAQLSVAEKNIITKSVESIDNWNSLCEHGVTIAMQDNVDIQYIQTASNQLKQTSISVRNNSVRLRQKLANYNIHC